MPTLTIQPYPHFRQQAKFLGGRKQFCFSTSGNSFQIVDPELQKIKTFFSGQICKQKGKITIIGLSLMLQLIGINQTKQVIHLFW